MAEPKTPVTPTTPTPAPTPPVPVEPPVEPPKPVEPAPLVPTPPPVEPPTPEPPKPLKPKAEPSKPTEPVEPPTPEITTPPPPPPSPPAPPVAPVEPYPFEGTLDDRIGEGAWTPKHWRELAGKMYEYVQWQRGLEDSADVQRRGEISEGFDKTFEEMRTEELIPKVENRNDNKDVGIQAEREILRIAIEFGDPESGKILPLRKAHEIYKVRQSAGVTPQPPGAAAPISGGEGGAASKPGLDYFKDVHGKKSDEIVQEALDRGEV